MNKKVLGLVVAFMAVAMLAAPVMAKPATKIEGVTATIAFTFMAPGDSTFISVQKDDLTIQHVRDGISSGTVDLTIPEVGTLEGDQSGEWISRGKFYSPQPPWPDAETSIISKHVWTFTDALGYTGTFEGVVHSKAIGHPPPLRTYVEYHMVLQGTGDFEGQTLKLSYAGAPPSVLEGCLIMPK